MATKNLIVYILWIIQVYEIPRTKQPIQNCLGYVLRERVGIDEKAISRANRQNNRGRVLAFFLVFFCLFIGRMPAHERHCREFALGIACFLSRCKHLQPEKPYTGVKIISLHGTENLIRN